MGTEYLSWWLKENSTRGDTHIALQGLEFFVPKSVFSPDPSMTNSTAQLLSSMPSKIGGHVLDLGTGCGVLAVHAAKRGGIVVASDFSDSAIASASINAKSHHVEDKINFVSSDLFDSIDGKFNLITANLPIVDDAWEGLLHSVEDQMTRFFKDLPDHLERGGLCLLSFASFGNVTAFHACLNNQPLPFQEFQETKFGINWSVFKLTHT